MSTQHINNNNIHAILTYHIFYLAFPIIIGGVWSAHYYHLLWYWHERQILNNERRQNDVALGYLSYAFFVFVFIFSLCSEMDISYISSACGVVQVIMARKERGAVILLRYLTECSRQKCIKSYNVVLFLNIMYHINNHKMYVYILYWVVWCEGASNDAMCFCVISTDFSLSQALSLYTRIIFAMERRASEIQLFTHFIHTHSYIK